MTRRELQQLIRLGEGFTAEFKQGGTTHLDRELCAFANATGGMVLGISEQVLRQAQDERQVFDSTRGEPVEP